MATAVLVLSIVSGCALQETTRDDRRSPPRDSSAPARKVDVLVSVARRPGPPSARCAFLSQDEFLTVICNEVPVWEANSQPWWIGSLEVQSGRVGEVVWTTTERRITDWLGYIQEVDGTGPEPVIADLDNTVRLRIRVADGSTDRLEITPDARWAVQPDIEGVGGAPVAPIFIESEVGWQPLLVGRDVLPSAQSFQIRSARRYHVGRELFVFVAWR